jgi:hypothetical protein
LTGHPTSARVSRSLTYPHLIEAANPPKNLRREVRIRSESPSVCFRELHKPVNILIVGILVVAILGGFKSNACAQGMRPGFPNAPLPPSPPTIIDFEDLAAGTSVESQYIIDGVRFNPTNGVIFRIAEVGSDFAESGTKVLEYVQASGSEELPVARFTGVLLRSASYLGVMVGSPIAGLIGSANVTLRGFDRSHNLIATAGPEPLVEGTHIPLAIIGSDITEFEISTGVQDGGFPLAIDDFAVVPSQVATPFIKLHRLVTETSLHVAPGADASDQIEIQRGNGSSGSVLLSISNISELPPGVSAIFQPNPTSGNLESLRLSAAPWASSSETISYELIVVGTPLDPAAGTESDKTRLRLFVEKRFTVESVRDTVLLSASAEIPITITRVLPFSHDVDLSLSPLPPGYSGALTKTTITAHDYAGGGGNANLTLHLTADATTRVGEILLLTIQGRSGGETSSGRIIVKNILGNISSFFPAKGTTPRFQRPGTTVILRGSGLAPSCWVKFGRPSSNDSVQISLNDVNPEHTEAKILLPRLSTSGPITVTVPGRRASFASTDTFIVDNYRNVNGYSFENLRHLGEFDLKDLVDVFGVEQACEHIDPCEWPSFGLVHCRIPIPLPSPTAMLYLLVANILNETDGGNCSGMSLSSQRFIHGDKDITKCRLQEGLTSFTVWNLKGPETCSSNTEGPPNSLKDYIHLRQLEYSSAEFLKYYTRDISANSHEGLPRIRSQLASYFRINEAPFISFNPYGGVGNGAHTVVPYDMENTLSGGLIVYVYDNNLPFTDCEAGPHGNRNNFESSKFIFDSSGDWSYAGAGFNWTGGSGDISVVPYHIFDNTTMVGSMDGLRMIIEFGSAALDQVTSQTGKTLLTDDGLINRDPGSAIPNTATFSFTNPGAPIYLFTDLDRYTEILKCKNANEYQSIFIGPQLTSRVISHGHSIGDSDSVTIGEGDHEVDFAPGHFDKKVDIEVTGRTSEGIDRSGELLVKSYAGGKDKLGFSATYDTVRVKHRGAPEGIVVMLSEPDRSGRPGSFCPGPLELLDGDQVVFIPGRWSTLSHSSATALIEHVNGETALRVLGNVGFGFSAKTRLGQTKSLKLARFAFPDSTMPSTPAALVQWGDGEVSIGKIDFKGSQILVSGSHAFRSVGHFPTKVQLSSTDGSPLACVAAAVVVGNGWNPPLTRWIVLLCFLILFLLSLNWLRGRKINKPL